MATNKKWVAENKDRVRAYYKKWYAKKYKAYYKKKRKKILATNKRWRDGEKGKAYQLSKLQREPNKILARKLLRQAVRIGKIKRLPCEKCGKPKTHGHHTDYSKPLDVMWFCVIHHNELHNN